MQGCWLSRHGASCPWKCHGRESSAPRQNSDSGLRWLCEWYMDIVNSCRAIVKPDVRGLLARTGSRRGGAPWLVAIFLPARHEDTSQGSAFSRENTKRQSGSRQDYLGLDVNREGSERTQGSVERTVTYMASSYDGRAWPLGEISKRRQQGGAATLGRRRLMEGRGQDWMYDLCPNPNAQPPYTNTTSSLLVRRRTNISIESMSDQVTNQLQI